MIEVFLGTALGVVLSLLASVFWQLWRLRHQLSDLRVQMATFRLARAEKSDGGGRPPEPPEGARRKGNLWVVPAILGLFAGLGRWLRDAVSSQRITLVAGTAATMAAAGAVLYIGGVLPGEGGQRTHMPGPRPSVAGPPHQVPPPKPGGAHTPRPGSPAASVSPSAGETSPTASPNPSATVEEVSAAPAEASPAGEPPTGAAPASSGGEASEQPSPGTAEPVAPPPAPAPSPTPSPGPSGLCLRVVVNPVAGVRICLPQTG